MFSNAINDQHFYTQLASQLFLNKIRERCEIVISSWVREMNENISNLNVN